MFNIYKASFDSRLFSIMPSCRCAHVSISDDSSSFVDIRLRWRNERTKLLTPPSAQITRRAAKGRTEIDLSSDSWLKIIKLLIDLLSLSLTRIEERIYFFDWKIIQNQNRYIIICTAQLAAHTIDGRASSLEFMEILFRIDENIYSWWS